MEENEKIIKNIISTMAIEGCNLNSEDIKILNSYLENNISEDEAIRYIKSDFLN